MKAITEYHSPTMKIKSEYGTIPWKQWVEKEIGRITMDGTRKACLKENELGEVALLTDEPEHPTQYDQYRSINSEE